MVHINLIPSWFIGYDMILQLIFAIITFTVSFYAFKIYNLSEDKKTKFFAVGFIFISLNYFIQSILNFLILSKLNESICTLMKIQGVNALNLYGIYSHMFFFVIGLLTLVYMTLNINSKKTCSLLITTTFLSIFFATNKVFIYYVISSVLLIYISLYYLQNYIQNKQVKTLLVLIAFIFLLFGNIHFIFSVNHSIYYIIGHLLELISYSLILLNLFLIFKNDKEKK